MKGKPFNHTSIQDTHPRSLTSLDKIVSKAQEIRIVTRPTKRFMKKLELEYLYCPDCESQEHYRNGKTKVGTQRSMCKKCNRQFVAQYDAVFPESTRRAIFDEEFCNNLKPTGLSEKGSGKKKYWKWARLETLQMLESQTIKIRANKIIKASPIRSDREYKVLVEFLVHEAYGRVVS